MQQSDLRIGNCIDVNGVAIVRGVTSGGIWIRNEAFVISQWKGILLTPEILVMCGFNGNSIGHHDTAFVLKADWREQPSFHFYIEYTDSPFENDKEMLYPIAHEIKYLHQLQNLYFALTGEELIINTDKQ